MRPMDPFYLAVLAATRDPQLASTLAKDVFLRRRWNALCGYHEPETAARVLLNRYPIAPEDS